jgi:hypothetical protein
MKKIKKAQKGSVVGKTNVIKSAGPKSGSGNPLTGRSTPPSNDGFGKISETAKKRMKAEAEGATTPIYTKTRILPEMSGKTTVKPPTATKSITKKKNGGKVVATKAKYGTKMKMGKCKNGC